MSIQVQLITQKHSRTDPLAGWPADCLPWDDSSRGQPRRDRRVCAWCSCHCDTGETGNTLVGNTQVGKVAWPPETGQARRPLQRHGSRGRSKGYLTELGGSPLGS